MITVSPSAHEQVKAYFDDNGKDIQPVRIFVSDGCGGPKLAMALDTAKPDDQVISHGGIEYIMEAALLEQARPVEIDYSTMGFSIYSNLELGSGCDSCGSSGSCCS